MILSCSRPQYLRMKRGESRFKDEQLKSLSAHSGEEVMLGIYYNIKKLKEMIKSSREDFYHVIYPTYIRMNVFKANLFY